MKCTILFSLLLVAFIFSCKNQSTDSTENNNTSISLEKNGLSTELPQSGWSISLGLTDYRQSSAHEWGVCMRVFGTGQVPAQLPETGYIWEFDYNAYDGIDNWKIQTSRSKRTGYIDGMCDYVYADSMARFKVRVTLTLSGETRTTKVRILGASVCDGEPVGYPNCDSFSDSDYNYFTTDFFGDPKRGFPPLTVSFTDESDPNPTSWDWDFGDGYSSTTQHPTHVYTNPGIYDVSLSSSNSSKENSKTEIDYINVLTPIPSPPVISFVCSNNVAKIQWNAVDYVETYFVYRQVDSGSFIKIATTSNTYYVDNIFLCRRPGSTPRDVTYKVISHNSAGNSSNSNLISRYLYEFDEF